MNYNYIINFDTLSTVEQSLSGVNNAISEASGSFSASAKSNVGKINEKLSTIANDLTKIASALSGMNSALSAYKSNISNLEANLVNFNVEGVDAPLEFIGNVETGGFTKNVDEVLMPVINGERDNNLELGFYRNGHLYNEFRKKYPIGIPGYKNEYQCTTLISAYISEQYGAQVKGDAYDYWRNYHNADPNSSKFTEGEKKFIQNFEFIDNPTKADLQEGDIIIWGPNSSFMIGSEWKEYGHCAIWTGEAAWGQHQRGAGNPDHTANDKYNIPDNMYDMYIIRPSRGA